MKRFSERKISMKMNLEMNIVRFSGKKVLHRKVLVSQDLPEQRIGGDHS